jgi:hypothetical protein
MNQQYRIPTLTSRSGTHPVTVAIGENPVLEALAQWDAMVAAVVPLGAGQGPKAIPDPPFHLGHRRGGRELKVAELPAGFEASVDEATVDGHRPSAHR